MDPFLVLYFHWLNFICSVLQHLLSFHKSEWQWRKSNIKSLIWFDLKFYICSNNNFTFALNNGTKESFQRAVSLSEKIFSSGSNVFCSLYFAVWFRNVTQSNLWVSENLDIASPTTDVRSTQSPPGGWRSSLEKHFQTRPNFCTESFKTIAC